MITEFLFALIVGLFTGGVSGYVGSLMLTKRISLIGGPLGHLTLPGIAIAFYYGFDVSLGALAFLVFGTSLIWLLHQKTKLPMEAVTATVFSKDRSISNTSDKINPTRPNSKKNTAEVMERQRIVDATISVTAIRISAPWGRPNFDR